MSYKESFTQIFIKKTGRRKGGREGKKEGNRRSYREREAFYCIGLQRIRRTLPRRQGINKHRKASAGDWA